MINDQQTYKNPPSNTHGDDGFSFYSNDLRGARVWHYTMQELEDTHYRMQGLKQKLSSKEKGQSALQNGGSNSFPK